MSEPAKVRLVRCPKCHNLLPEVTDFSVYQCGGCGALLRGEKSEEERVGGISEKFSEECEQVNSSEKRIMDLNDGSESDLRSNLSSSSRGERRRILLDRADSYGYKSMNTGEKHSVDLSGDGKSDGLGMTDNEEDFQDLKMYSVDENGLRRSGRTMDWRNQGRNHVEGYRRAPRYVSSMYSEEGSSYGQPSSNYEVEGPTINKNDISRFNKVDYAEEDQAELLRSEQEDRLSRTGILVDKAKEKIPLVRRSIHQDSDVVSQHYFPDRSSGMEIYNGDDNWPRRSGNLTDWRHGKQIQLEGLKDRRMEFEGTRYAASMHSGEGLLSNHSRTNSDNEYQMKNLNKMDSFNKVDYVGEGPAELLRKMDELKDQLDRSSKMADKAKEKVPLDRRTIHQDSYASSENWYPERSSGMNMNEDKKRLQWSRHMMDRRSGERNQIEGFRMARIMDVEGARYAASLYLGEGPSDYDYEDQVKSKIGLNGFNKGDYVGEDQAEILRKIDELKDRLSWSGEMVEKDSEKVPLDRRTIHQDPVSENWYSDGSLEINRRQMQHSYPDKQFGRPSYLAHYAESSVLMHRQEMRRHNVSPPRYASSHAHGYVDPEGPQRLRRVPGPPLASFQQYSSYAYVSREYMENDMVYSDRVESYPSKVSRHHPSCSCSHCHNKTQVSLPVPPNAPIGQGFSNVPDAVVFNHNENPSSMGPREYGSRTRLPSELNMEANDFVHPSPHRLRAASRGRICRPVAGGAPFFICYNCFELLQLPKKFITDGRNKGIRCEACSTIIAFTVSKKKLSIAIHVEENNTVSAVEDSHDFMSKEGDSRVREHVNRVSITFSSYDYDNSGCDFHSMDRELEPVSMDQASSTKSAERKILQTTSSRTSEGDEGKSTSATRRDPDSAEFATKRSRPVSPEGSTIEDCNSNKYHEVNHFGDGNKSEHNEEDDVLLNKKTEQQDSMKSTSAATEIDIPTNEYSNTGTSLDSGEGSREGDRLRGRAAQSYIAGIMNNSFRRLHESNQSVEQEIANVTVNGHLITDRLIKKAEKLAGPILPGHYWYDFRAGFWGEVGGPCLGIIPPFIPEFNHPMPANCAGGNTTVFVNGRELHRRDLNLLGSRGLPKDGYRSYIVEISGRILDEDTGEELESLGKLAPSVEKVKRGFGMRPPIVAA